MIGRLNHVAIATNDLKGQSALYATQFGADVSNPQDLPEHGVTVVFVNLPNTKVELLAALGAKSPIASFLERNPAGGIHHLCFEVEDIDAACQTLRDQGMRVLGDGSPSIGAHGKPVVFLHPRDAGGVLVELEQV